MVGERRRPMVGERRRLGRRRARARALVRVGASPWCCRRSWSSWRQARWPRSGRRRARTGAPWTGATPRWPQPLVAQIQRLGRGVGRRSCTTPRRSAGSPSSPTSTPRRPTPARRAQRFDAITPPDPAVGRRRCADGHGRPGARRLAVRAAFEGVLGGAHRARRRRRGRRGRPGAGRRDSCCVTADASWAACRRAPAPRARAARAWPPRCGCTTPTPWTPAPSGTSSTRWRRRAPSLRCTDLTILAVVTDPAAVPSGQTAVAPPTTKLVAHVVLANGQRRRGRRRGRRRW